MSEMFDWEAPEELFKAVRATRTLQIVAILADGPQHFNDLAKRTGLDHQCVNRRLRRLEAADLVCRAVEVRPIRVQYRLTDSGWALIPLLDSLARWWRTRRP